MVMTPQKSLFDRQPGPRKEKIPLTEMELHKGWIENLTNEERTMKDSIKNCIDGGYTKDVSRAKEIYKFSFEDGN